MELKKKKQLGGSNKTAAIFDTKGIKFDTIVDEMVSDGWTFEKLVVSYANKSGGTSKREVETQQVKPIQKKYNFDNWAFKARRNNQVISGYVVNSKNTAVITESKGRAIESFIAIGEEGNANYSRPIDNAPITPQRMQQGFIEQPSYIQNDASAAAAASLYADEPEEQVGISETQREDRKQAERELEQEKLDAIPKKKHTGLIVLAILEILLIASIFCGIVGLVDTIGARKRLNTDPEEAVKRFKLARSVLILGIIVDVICIAVAVWKFGPIIMALLA